MTIAWYLSRRLLACIGLLCFLATSQEANAQCNPNVAPDASITPYLLATPSYFTTPTAPAVVSAYQTRCNNYVGAPLIFSGNLEIAIARIISRSVDMHDLASFNAKLPGYVYDSGTHTNSIASGSSHTIYYDATVLPGSSTYRYNNTYLGPPLHPRYDVAEGTVYHPETYAKSIKLLVDLNAQLITRVAMPSNGNEGNFFPAPNTTSLYRDACRQVVVDINAAYDSKGLRRPVIGGAILEGVGDVHDVIIEPRVIATFEPQMTTTEYAYYHSSTLPIKYTGSNIVNGPYADLSRIEARMLFYQEAIAFVDMGYRALHMGVYWEYSRYDINYTKTAALYDQIRAYARGTGSFVLLSGENAPLTLSARGYASGDNGYSAREGNTDKLLFDFDGRALHPREYLAPSYPGEFSCSGSYSTVPPSSCTALQAVVDPCVLENFGGTSTGLGPLGRSVSSVTASGTVTYPPLVDNTSYRQVPYHAYFDFGPGWGDSGPSTGGTLDQTYGYDDTKWFAETQTNGACRADWLVAYYNDRRNYHLGNGYLQIPGILTVKEPNNLYVPGPIPRTPITSFPNLFQNNLPSSVNGYYVMANEDAAFVTKIKNMLKPAPLVIKVQQVTFIQHCITCSGIPNQNKVVLDHYDIDAVNPDKSSIYTIHIQNADTNDWLPFTYGPHREFRPPIAGNYRIFIRQDNPGFNAVEGNGGSEGTYQDFKPFYCNTADSYSCQSPCTLQRQALATAPSSTTADIRLSPVPAQGLLTVEAVGAGTGTASFCITNALGQTVKTGTLPVAPTGQTTTLDLRGQAAGLYVLKVLLDGQPLFRKFLLE